MDKTHVYVMIPYRARGKHLDRKPQLEFLIPYLANYLKDQGLEFTIMVMEQNDDDPFNYGKLKNCGVLECKKMFKRGYRNVLVNNNVDIIPKKIKYTGYPKGFTNACGYPKGCGGLCFFDIESFETVNGFPNNLAGWGAEDTALIDRCIMTSVPFQNHEHINDPEYMTETDTAYRDVSPNQQNIWLSKQDLENNLWRTNGLSTCKYNVDKVRFDPNTNCYHFWFSFNVSNGITDRIRNLRK